MLILLSGFSIRLPGTEVVTDPREMFVTMGAALTGPLGGALIGFMCGVFDPTPGWTVIVMIYHAAGGLWIGFAYKKLIYRHLKMPLLLAGWLGSVAVYYYGFLVPISIYLTYAVQPALFEKIFGETSPSLGLLVTLYKFLVPEAVLTSLVTLLVLLALPAKYRRPLW